MDLREWDFMTGGPVSLNGEWEFYWSELLEPVDFAGEERSSVEYLEVPGFWSRVPEDTARPSYGFGTYRLTVLTAGRADLFAVKMREVQTAYRLWINGEEIASAGQVGRSRETSVPRYQSHVTCFSTDKRVMEIVLQVSNYHYPDGGIRDAIELGTGSALTLKREKSLVLDYILFGSLFIMAIYHIGLYTLRKEEKSTLVFAVICFLMTIRVLVTNEMFFTTLFPNTSWFVHLRIIVLDYFLAAPFFLIFINILYPDKIRKSIFKILLGTSFLFCAIAAFAPPFVYIHSEVYNQGLILLMAAIILINLIRAARNREEGSRLIIAGVLIFFLTVLSDILYAQGFTHYRIMQSLTPLGLFIFILFQSLVLSRRFSWAFIIANRDELTRANNRRRFQELAEESFQKSQRLNRSLSLLFIDIDYFKKINDTYGHDAGDEVLSQLSLLCRNRTAEKDYFGRMGGEEFALMIHGTLDYAFLFAEELRREIGGKKIYVDGKAITVTVSIGISSTEQEGIISLKKMFKCADVGLYKAKNGGRDRVERGVL